MLKIRRYQGIPTTTRSRRRSSGRRRKSCRLACESLESRALLSASPWQNPELAADANNDGKVTPADALVICNRINEGGNGKLGVRGANEYYVDTTGNGALDPTDMLLVVNVLNRVQAEMAEGESNDGETNGISHRVQLLERITAELMADLEEVTSDSAELRTDVDELKEASEELKSDVDELRTDVDQLRTDLDEIEPIPGPAGPAGPQGEPGPAGPQGPAGGVSGWEIVEDRFSFDDENGFRLVRAEVDCPAGKVVTGGGVKGNAVSLTNHIFSIESSYPLDDGSGWHVDVYNTEGSNSLFVDVYAICVTLDT